jgi:ribose transport system ATP-binding protein
MSGSSSEAAAVPLLEARGVSKAFPGVQALDGVDFDVYPSEVHVLVGENGAGKSTLIKTFAGVYQPDEGEIRFRGEPMAFGRPSEALDLGVATVYQELDVIKYMTVAENLFLGHEPTRGVALQRRKRSHVAREYMRQLEVEIDPDRRVSALGVAQQQIVAILKALTTERVTVLMLDEPTAAISRHEIDVLFSVIRRLRERGVGIVYISHRLEEIRQIGDRVSIFRDGSRITTTGVDEIEPDRVIELMVGRPVTQLFPERLPATTQVALRVRGMSVAGTVVTDLSFELRSGEVVGLFGLVGAGRTELLRGLFGIEPSHAGEVEMFGRKVSIRSPNHAVRHGLGLAPENRKEAGIVPHMSVEDNITLSSGAKVSVGPVLSRARRRREAAHYVEMMRIATPSVRTLIRSLSGGNQQKCLLARLLSAGSRVLLLDEPTRGIDVGARAGVYELINQLAGAGHAVLLVSSDLVEVMGMSDRVLVMRKGRISAEFERSRMSEEAIMRAAVPERLDFDAEGAAA